MKKHWYKKISLLVCSNIILTTPVLLFLNKTLTSNYSTNLVTFNNQKINNKEDKKENRSYYSLRDDYLLFHQLQDQSGLCWDFSSIKALETALMINNNEMYDLSEASIAAQLENRVANGANFFDFHNALKNGVAFESDFIFSDLYYLPNSGTYYKKILDLYKPKFIHNLADKLQMIIFDRYNIKNDLNDIKYHISNNSALMVGIEYWTIKSNNSNNNKKTSEIVSGYGANGHAVSIIGWDDNYKCSDGSNGAFIVLNSDNKYQNNDGVNYLPYNTNVLYMNLYGYKYLGDKLITSKSTNSIINKYSGYYNSQNKQVPNSNSQPLNQNVFNWTDDIKIEYHFNTNIADLIKMDVQIYLDNLNITDKFKITNNNSVTNVSYEDKSNKLKPGSYTVKLNYKYKLKSEPNQLKTQQEIRQIYIFDGSENLYSGSAVYTNSNNDYSLVVHSSNSYSANNKIPVFLTSKKQHETNYDLNYGYAPTYLNADNNIEYRIGDNKIGSLEKSTYAFNLNFNFLNDKYTDNHFKIDIDKYVNNIKTDTKKYQVFRLDTDKQYIIAKLYFDTNNRQLNNLVNEVVFENNNNSFRWYLDSNIDTNLKIKEYQYVDSSGNYQTLLKDHKGYYIDQNLVKKLQTGNGNLNYIGSTIKETNSYRYPVIIKPIFENNTPDFKVEVNKLKQTFQANDIVQPIDFEINITDKGQNITLIPDRIVYQNNQSILKGDHNSVILQYHYKNKVYDQKVDINVNKKVIYHGLQLISNKLKHDPINGVSPEFNQLIDANLVEIRENWKNQIGKYNVVLKILDPNYVFENQKDTMSLEWYVVDDLSSDIIYNDQLNNNISNQNASVLNNNSNDISTNKGDKDQILEKLSNITQKQQYKKTNTFWIVISLLISLSSITLTGLLIWIIKRNKKIKN
ncbi:C1 family peptidase [Mycoplasma mycoides subsp. capri]|uniref:C1 family peptidase n=1 Tax=Mycoplasma mycoides TaxID=2102 RepID=UPI00224013F6|nr:C1 family peptidase [Mycoplasma mycoides]QVJ96618.1 C1 family peptidase [Mycoplasma mycoides subsp. capri]QVJ97508.1 C1 family peptidase [Mycoplasma mycoides subsp. capri]QVK00500.1 C1 family peptidase [Mycoplasma mycoides subsp. capri]QVK01387.1 C1 family peptidase [Mycoplasma mycoides subsp. capri]